MRRRLSTRELAVALGYGSAESIRVNLCRNGSFYGVVPDRLPNGRLAWPEDAVDRILAAGRKRQSEIYERAEALVAARKEKRAA